MKKILLFLGVFGFLAGCGTDYKVKNDSGAEIKAGGEAIAAGQCGTFTDSFFGGDFPLQFKAGDVVLKGEGDKEEFEAGHYVVGDTVSKVTEAPTCATPAEGTGTGDGETPAAGTGDGETPAAGTGDGETPAAGTGDGETPAAGTGDGETPAAGTGDGETPTADPAASAGT